MLEVAAVQHPAFTGEAAGGDDTALIVAFQQNATALGQGVERALFRTGDVHFRLSGTGVGVRPASIIQTRGVTSGLGRVFSVRASGREHILRHKQFQQVRG